jgi:hypothetical protein
MSGVFRLKFFLLVIAWFSLACMAPAMAQVRNLTRENEQALSDKIIELRQTELLRLSRGRVKPNPIILPHLTVYQSVIMNQDVLLSRQLDEYRTAMLETQRARDDFRNFLATPRGREVSDIFDARLIETYSLTEELETVETMWEVWSAVAVSSNALATLPLQFRMALNTGSWLRRAFGDAVPPDIHERYLELCRAELAPYDVFHGNLLLDELSKKHSELFRDAMRGGEAP